MLGLWVVLVLCADFRWLRLVCVRFAIWLGCLTLRWVSWVLSVRGVWYNTNFTVGLSGGVVLMFLVGRLRAFLWGGPVSCCGFCVLVWVCSSCFLGGSSSCKFRMILRNWLVICGWLLFAGFGFVKCVWFVCFLLRF